MTEIRAIYPFLRDYTGHQVDNIRVQWNQSIKDLTDYTLLNILLQNVSTKNESIGKTSYLGIMDIIKHGKTVFLIESMKKGGVQAMRKLFENVDLLYDGWNGLGAGMDIFEALLNAGECVRLFLLNHWSLILSPVKKKFEILEKIMSFDEYNPILSYALGMESMRRLTNKSDLISQKIRKHRSVLKAHCYQDPRNILNGEEGVKFSDYLRRLEVIFLTSLDTNESSIKLVFRANKRLDPTHLTMAETNTVIPIKGPDEVIGPRLEYFNLEDRDRIAFNGNSECFLGDISILADNNLQSVIFCSIQDMSIMKLEQIAPPKVKIAPVSPLQIINNRFSLKEANQCSLPQLQNIAYESVLSVNETLSSDTQQLSPLPDRALSVGGIIENSHRSSEKKASFTIFNTEEANAQKIIQEVFTNIANEFPDGNYLTRKQVEYSDQDKVFESQHLNDLQEKELANQISMVTPFTDPDINQNYKSMSNITTHSKLDSSKTSRDLKSNTSQSEFERRDKYTPTMASSLSNEFIHDLRKLKLSNYKHNFTETTYNSTPPFKGVSAVVRKRRFTKRIPRKICNCFETVGSIKSTSHEACKKVAYLDSNINRHRMQIQFGSGQRSWSRNLPTRSYESSTSTVDCF